MNEIEKEIQEQQTENSTLETKLEDLDKQSESISNETKTLDNYETYIGKITHFTNIKSKYDDQATKIEELDAQNDKD